VKRGDIEAVKGLRIGAAPGPDSGIVQLLKDAGIDPERNGIDIIHDDSVDQMADLDAFAAQVAAMDAVVTISNTTAHMAGGLGVKTLLMLDSVPIWYWQLDRPDSLWYSSLKLYRQTRPSDWADVIDRVAKKIKEMAALQ